MGRLPMTGYFLGEAGLVAAGCCFVFEALLALVCFCADFFWFAFGDLSPMVLFGYFDADMVFDSRMRTYAA